MSCTCINRTREKREKIFWPKFGNKLHHHVPLFSVADFKNNTTLGYFVSCVVLICSRMSETIQERVRICQGEVGGGLYFITMRTIRKRFIG